MISHLSRVLLVAALCLFTLSQCPLIGRAEETSWQLAKVAEPLRQQVHLKLDPAQDSFSGETTIQLKVLTETQMIELSGRDYTLLSAELSGAQTCTLTHEMLKEAKVKLSCAQALPVGEYALKMSFTAPYNRQSVGLYKTEDQGVPYLFTQFEMMDARRVFPLFDEPRYKIPFQVKVTAPKGQSVFTNTPLAQREEQEGQVTHTFAETLPIPSYLIALAVGPLEVSEVPESDPPMKIITSQGKRGQTAYAQKTTPQVLAALEAYFGMPYPYKKLDSVAVPEFPFGAMENPGLVTYHEALLLLDEQSATREQHHGHIGVIAHELAHQWYGNLVTMTWWDDLWLNEAFASWMGEKITAQLHPELELHLSLPQNYVMGLDAQVSTKAIRKPIRNEADIMDGLGLAYSKGSALLSMVERWIGEAKFQAGIRAYLKRFSFKNARASDLWDALSEASGQDVASVLSSFTNQPSFPLIEVSLKGKQLTLSQQRFQLAGQEVTPQAWSVPIIIKYGAGSEVKTKRVVLTAEQASVTVTLAEEPEWIYPDEGAVGYYRWTLPKPLLDTLLSRSAEILTDRERLALLSTVEALLDVGQLNADALLATLITFVSDPHPKIARTAIQLLNKQSETFLTEGNRARWEQLFRELLKPALERIGRAAKPDEDPSVSELRSSLIGSLALFGQDQEVIEAAKERTQAFLSDPDKVDPYLVRISLIIASRHGDEALLKQYQAMHKSSSSAQHKVDLLFAMGSLGSAALQDAVMQKLLEGEFTASDGLYLIYLIASGEERGAHFRSWLSTHFDELIKRVPPYIAPNIPTFMGLHCDLEDFAEAERFLKPKYSQLEGLSREMDKLRVAVQSCVNLRDRGLEAVDRYLEAKVPQK